MNIKQSRKIMIEDTRLIETIVVFELLNLNKGEYYGTRLIETIVVFEY